MQPLGILIQAHACIRLPLVEVGGQFNSSFVRVYFTVCIAMHRDEMHVEPFLPHITLLWILEQTGVISPVLKQFRFAAGLKVGRRSSKNSQPRISDSSFQHLQD